MFVPTSWLVSFAAWLVFTLVLWQGDFPRWLTLVDVLGWVALALILGRYLVGYAILYVALKGVRAMLKRYRPELNHYWIPPKHMTEWAGLIQELDSALAEEEAFAQRPTPLFETYPKRVDRFTQGFTLANNCIRQIKHMWTRVDEMQREWVTQLDQLTQAVEVLAPPVIDDRETSEDLRQRLREQARVLGTVRTTAVQLLNSERRTVTWWSPLVSQARRAGEVVHEAEAFVRSS